VALLRRNRRRPGSGRLRIGSRELDPLAHQVGLDGHRLELSKKELGLLRALATEPARLSTNVNFGSHVPTRS
jgi:DNA-binding response OmpR family regulator